MAANLMKRGFPVTIWNRSAARCAPLVEIGADIAESPAELARSSDVVVSMLRDDQVVRELLLESAVPAAQAGMTLIEMSTVTPALCRQLAAATAERQCSYLDAPVLGSRDAAAAGALTIIVGGPAETLEQHEDVLRAMGQKIMHVGPNGAGALFKLANNQFVAVLIASLGESLGLIEKAGLDRSAALKMLAETAARVIGMKQEMIAERKWETHFALELMRKDIGQTLAAAHEVKASMPVLVAASETYDRALEQGKGALDFAAVTTVDEHQEET